MTLEQRFLEPSGWRWHTLKNSHGKKMRFGTAAPESRIPDAVVVLLPGRTEYAEKYFETVNDLLKRNLSVWIFEWQGQGLSDRFITRYPQRSHSPPFSSHVADLHEFILEYVKHASVHPDVGRIPMVMLAQSMGGNIGMRYLHAHPDVFTSAVFCAPMLGIPSVDKVPAGRILIRILSVLTGKRYAFGQMDWKENERMHSPIKLSGDEMRSKIHDWWMNRNPELRVGGATFGWVYQAIMSCQYLRKRSVLKAISLPCLIALAKGDNLVDNEAIRFAAKTMPNARLLELEDSGHEILMERDSIRDKFLEVFMQFIQQTIIDKPETLKRF